MPLVRISPRRRDTKGGRRFAAIAKKLGDNPGLRPQDVFINLVEVAKENWSFGHGIAQYA